MDKKNLAIAAIAIIAIVAAAAITNAQMSSSKSGVAGNNIKLLESGSTVTDSMGTVFIKTPNQKDLIISVSAEAMLFTDTRVKGNKGDSLTNDEDIASIQVWAEVDGDGNASTEEDNAFPGPVTFAERIQTMEGRLSNVTIDECWNADLGEYELCWTNLDEEVRLMLDTTNANSFNFIALDVPQGEHNITVFATLSTKESGDFTNDSPKAVLGKRTIVVQEIRLTQGTEI